MKIFNYPDRSGEFVKKISVPQQLAKYLVPWSDSTLEVFEFGNILIQEFTCKHYSIYMYRFSIEKPTCLSTYFEQPTIAFQFTMEGKIPGTLKGAIDVSLEEGTYGLFYLPQGIHEVRLEKCIAESIHFEFLPSWLDDLALTNEHIDALVRYTHKGNGSGIIMPAAPIDYMVRHYLTEILTCNETGADLLMELKTCILNLLNIYRKAIKEKELLSRLPIVPYREQLLNIREKIKANPNIHLHSVLQLGKENYLHAKTLNRNFRKLFNTDISSFVHQQCMDKGYHLITATENSIEDIADELGYRDVSNFYRAFKRRFNVAPISLRAVKFTQ